MLKFIRKMRDRLLGQPSEVAKEEIAKELPLEDSAPQKENQGGKKGGSHKKKQRKRTDRANKSENHRGTPAPLEKHQLPQIEWNGWPGDAEEIPQGKVAFASLNLPEHLQKGVFDLGFSYCTDIQGMALPQALDGKDVVGKALTGSGKTAAFLMTIMTGLIRNPQESVKRGTPRAICLAPTRELALQIAKDAANIGKHCDFNVATLIGGTGMDKQERELDGRVDILIGTPGRILDFMFRKKLELREIEYLIVDEADRMLDMGFIPDMRRIIGRMPAKEKRQTHLYSATFSPEVLRLAQQWNKEDHALVEIEVDDIIPEKIDQCVYTLLSDQKVDLVANLFQKENVEKMMIFCNRKYVVEDIAHELHCRGIAIEVMSGDIPQNKRMKVIEKFKSGEVQAVVATDVAGRGIHVDGVTHVVNYDLPYEPEDYVHRVGRTGRAGASGRAISFACEMSAHDLPAIEDYVGYSLPVQQPPEGYLEKVEKVREDSPFHSRSERRSGGHRGRGNDSRSGGGRGRSGGGGGRGRSGGGGGRSRSGGGGRGRSGGGGGRR